MAPKKSVFRQPGAQHFQLVHRSQRDPLINDPEASQRVLKPVGRANDRDRHAGTTLAELEAALDKTKIRDNEGEAAAYGITYDDSGYDYMQHLKPVGLSGPGGSGGDSFLIAAPRGSGVAAGMKGQGGKGKGKAKAAAEELFADLPGVLASDREITLQQAYAREENIPKELQGLQPDMDPHLRQVLEALEDEAFEDADGDEGWFGDLVGGGELEEGEEAEEYEFQEWGVDEDQQPAPAAGPHAPQDLPDDAPWQDRFKAFKLQQAAAGSDAGGSADDGRSEMADTIGSLPASMADMIVRGGKKRRGKRGPSDATGMSMSSSSMFRNEGLRDLDESFDRIERDYDIEEEDEDGDFLDSASVAPSMMSGMSGMSGMSSTSRVSLFSSTSTTAPQVSREDFDAILDDFLDNFEVVGSKYRPALGTTRLTGPEKLQVLRSAVEGEVDGIGKEENRRRILEIERMGRGVGAGKIEKMDKVRREEDEGDKWDVETVLTTYTNTENHPAMIRSRTAAQAKARAGMINGNSTAGPSSAGVHVNGSHSAIGTSETREPSLRDGHVEDNDEDEDEDDDDSDDSGSETETEAPKVTVARPKGESTEDRKARKAAVKAGRSARRVEKKTRQEAFGTERRKALAHHKKLVGGGKAADMLAGARGVVSLS